MSPTSLCLLVSRNLLEGRRVSLPLLSVEPWSGRFVPTHHIGRDRETEGFVLLEKARKLRSVREVLEARPRCSWILLPFYCSGRTFTGKKDRCCKLSYLESVYPV